MPNAFLNNLNKGAGISIDTFEAEGLEDSPSSAEAGHVAVVVASWHTAVPFAFDLVAWVGTELADPSSLRCA